MSGPTVDVDGNGRAVSTVLDVGLCLLFVVAAVATVTTVHPPEPDPAARAAGETATTLAATTATVTYSLSAAADAATDPSFPRTGGPGFVRHERGTLASLLADAAMANLSVAGRPLTPLGTAFGAAVREAVAPLLVGPGWRGQVVVRWAPYRGAALRAVFTAGATPPHGADVHAATLAVPSGITPHRQSPRMAAREGFVELAGAIAGAVVRSRFPPARTRVALAGAYPEPQLTALRYHGFADAYGTDVGSQVAATDPTAANRRLVGAMTDDVATRLRRRFADRLDAAAALAFRTVTIVVRTWST